MIVEYHVKLQKNHALLNRVTNATSKDEQDKLEEISKKMKIYATLLPIRSVGVQGILHRLLFIFGKINNYYLFFS